ncbi:SAUR family protein [Marchantia polymorpha subsp. ruderalis]|uniref:Uncharacterized protein n=2 Tax=Marchantia polymorpha TaxID=3197 RepID=A0AAF6AV27_MARPO|nr:hypothetical protein MARPO_0002s0082 [Marchantia polymorpha]BBN00298.1 hypothetical protein Mp_1g27960 [Marchantia polymorpha subsp. ruderalis]|eukprot:PTQ49585.1 hypothetical protein MARPO_0002s0082 [Marchantia polymorpha]
MAASGDERATTTTTMSDEYRMSPSRGTTTTEEKCQQRARKSHFFSRSLSRGNFSWSFVRSALQPAATRSSGLSSSSANSLCSDEFPMAASRSSGSTSASGSGSVSNVSDVSSDACSSCSTSTSTSTSSPRSQSRRSAGTSGKRKGSKLSSGERKAVLVDKVPFGKSSKYLTVYVGPRIEQSVKYVISRKLLAHPLFQVLLKCSEDEFGEDFSVEKGVAIICDPALFLQVVRAVDDNMWNAQSAGPDDSDSNYE